MSNCTVTTAIWPFFEMNALPNGPNGSVTLVTLGIFSSAVTLSLDRRLHRRARDAVGGLEHDDRVVAGTGREVLLEEVERLLRLRAGDAEVVAELAVEAGGERDDRRPWTPPTRR